MYVHTYVIILSLLLFYMRVYITSRIFMRIENLLHHFQKNANLKIFFSYFNHLEVSNNKKK